MKNILAFGASSSKNSVNKSLAAYAANQLEGVNITLLDLNDFETVIYSIDKEEAGGIPEVIKAFKKHIQDTDGIVVSFAEHNGSYSSAFKNIMDWTSRIAQKLWEGKPMFILATSPGGRGGQTVLETAKNSFPHMGASVTGVFSLPSFYDNFTNNDIVNNTLKTSFKEQLALFEKSI